MIVFLYQSKVSFLALYYAGRHFVNTSAFGEEYLYNFVQQEEAQRLLISIVQSDVD